MSYILEALKRSEQERHQGELNPTTIDTIMLPSKQVRHQWWPYLLIVILAINVLVYLYFQFPEETMDVQDDDKVDQISNILVQENNVSNNDFVYEQEQKVVNQQAKQIQSQFTTEKPLPEHLSQTPILTKRYDISVKTQGTKALNSYQSKKKSFTDEGFEIIKPKETTDNVSPSHTMLSQTEKNNLNSQSGYQGASQQVTPVPELADAPVQQAAVERVKLENFENTYHLSDLDLSFQKGIPDISFNSHIYSANSADRRVMINDLYLREGQDFSGITIETIGEFYIVLSKNSQRFKIPVLRDWFTPEK